MGLDLAILGENFDVMHFAATLYASFGAYNLAAGPLSNRFDSLRQRHAVGL
jgi:hypothetical protein